MKHQQVSVDYWAMSKAMLMYGFLTLMGWVMMRLFNMVFTLPRRMRAQQDNLQNTLAELQRKFPDLNITEDDLINAEQELEAILKEDNEKTEKELTESTEETKKGEIVKTEETKSEDSNNSIESNNSPPPVEDKKTI